MADKKIILILENQIAQKDKDLLFGNGYMVIEVKDFDGVKFVSGTDTAEYDLLFSSLIGAANCCQTSRNTFGEELLKKLVKKLIEPATPPAPQK